MLQINVPTGIVPCGSRDALSKTCVKLLRNNMQVLQPMQSNTMLDLILTEKDELITELKIDGCLSASDHDYTFHTTIPICYFYASLSLTHQIESNPGPNQV